ncbi:MAG: hypothetical protein H6551_12930 [Chitinophagales bacterium]|nr:hypothetical protein [Chitinophagaceae bacterium]MCB9066036.1 hypothetical protein [Chitinophagales bacterium]
MKKLLRLVFVGALSLSSCKKDETTTPVAAQSTATIIKGGGWGVGYIQTPSGQKAANYKAYEIIFGTSGITARTTTEDVNGEYAVSKSNGIEMLTIALNTTNTTLMELNADWTINSASNNKIDLSFIDSKGSRSLTLVK